MTHQIKRIIHSLFIGAVLACALGAARPTMGQVEVATYMLDNVFMLPDVSHTFPGDASPMIGYFEWTYPEGEFENGTGEFVELFIPWYGTDFMALNINIDTASTELTLPGNFDGRGVDITMFLQTQLSPDEPSEIDLAQSIFEIQNGPPYQGHFVSGRFVRVGGACPGDINNDRVVNADDLAVLLAAWRSTDGSPADLTGDGIVQTGDLAILLASWGMCP